MTSQIVYIVDDEPDILELVSVNLRRIGYKVSGYPDAETFLHAISHEKPDLIILDLMLPDMDGLEICKLLRKNDRYLSVPIIMLTARQEETDKVLGLELGADDYITKPFSIRELVARVRAVLRRKLSPESPKISIGDSIVLDLETYEVMVNGKKIDFTLTEFKILQCIASKKGRVYTRENILDFLWGNEKTVVDRTIDVHIRHLRKKLGKAASFIKNVRGMGYKIEE